MDQSHLAEEAVRHNLLEYAELFLFLLTIELTQFKHYQSGYGLNFAQFAAITF